MVVYVMRYNIRPDQAAAYDAWVMPATRRCLAVPGVVELRAYRSITGPLHVTAMWEFGDLQAWGAWYAEEVVKRTTSEMRTLVSDLTLELWDSSPVVPAPLRPEK